MEKRSCKKLSVLLIVFFLSLPVSLPGFPGNALAQSSSFSGIWDGKWNSDWGDQGAINSTVQQSGSTLSGTLTIRGTDCYNHPDFLNLPLSGTVSGNQAAFNASATCPADNSKLSLAFTKGTLSGNLMTGEYVLLVNGSFYDSGSFSLTRSTVKITATAGTGGKISPSGSVSIPSGSSKTFTITPNAGYRIKGVLVDGASKGAISSYTFSNVTANHTISASFALAVAQLNTKVPASDGKAGDQFGSSVSMSKDTIVAGAPGDDDKGSGSGSVYVYVLDNGAWIKQAKLVAGDGAGGDSFGRSVGLSGDTIVVGAPGDDVKGSNSGSAYVFVRTNGVWKKQARLVPSDGGAGDSFGSSVAISGSRIVVGAPGDDDKGANAGAAYVFVRSNGAWSMEKKLRGNAEGDTFGVVAISSNTIVIGSPGNDDNGANAGSAYIYFLSDGIWKSQKKLLPSDGAPGDSFGCSVGINLDTVVIGARGKDIKGSSSGAAYVAVRSDGVWGGLKRLLAPDGAEYDLFGQSVAVSGSSILVGAPGDDDKGAKAGAAYLFTRSSTGSWQLKGKLLAGSGAAGDSFGSSVYIYGSKVVVGAPGDSDLGDLSGSVFVNSPVFTQSLPE
ncbi:MAG: hypothetical protein AB9866_29740 [Syntrophobacteraceae bacterium]